MKIKRLKNGLDQSLEMGGGVSYKQEDLLNVYFRDFKLPDSLSLPPSKQPTEYIPSPKPFQRPHIYF